MTKVNHLYYTSFKLFLFVIMWKMIGTVLLHGKWMTHNHLANIRLMSTV